MLIRAPSLMRIELEDGYSIVDADARRSIAVNTAEKRAILVENQRIGLDWLPAGFSFYDMIRGLADREAERLDPRTIDGRAVPGFQIVGPLVPGVPGPQTTRVWVDPETRLPVRVETAMKAGDDELTSVMSDFAFDRELDPALFSFEPPEGFEVRRIGVPELKPEPPEEEAAALVLTGNSLGPVRFGDSKESCLEAFGEPDQVEDFGRGVMLEYYSHGFSLTVGHETGLRMISCYSDLGMAFTVRTFAGHTAEGIALGAGREAIEAAYGEPAHVHVARLRDALGDDAPNPDEPTGQVSLSYPDRGLTFTLFDGELYDIIA